MSWSSWVRPCIGNRSRVVSSWPRRFSLAALRAGASWSQVVETIVGALGYVDRLEDAEPVVNEGLELTDRDPQLLTRWIQWLADHGQPDRSGSLAREALAACLARLEAAPEDRSLIDPFVGALGYVDRLEDAEPVVNEGLELTDRDPQLLTRWIQWLADHGQPDRSGSLAREALAACLARLEAAPEDRSLIDPFVRALYSVTPTDRREAVDRAQTALGGRADELVELGQALYRQSFPGCELMAAEVSLAALRAGASWSQVVETIVGALGYVDRLEDAEPVVNEGLELTDRDPQLLTRWSQWLLDNGRPELAERAYLDALRRDPSLAVSGAEGILNVYARRRDNASLLRSFDRIDSVRGLSLYTVVWRASVYSGRGQVDQALDEILSGLALDNQDSYEYIELIERLLFTLRDLNRTREIYNILDELETELSGPWFERERQLWQVASWRARIAIYLGDATTASPHIRSTGNSPNQMLMTPNFGVLDWRYSSCKGRLPACETKDPLSPTLEPRALISASRYTALPFETWPLHWLRNAEKSKLSMLSTLNSGFPFLR